MRKALTRLLSSALVLSVLICAGCTPTQSGDDGRLRIVCTVFPEYDAVRAIAADCDAVDITLLLGPGQDSHDYDPPSHDIVAIHSCDIFVYVGGESDNWVRDMLESVDTSDKTVISLMDVTEVLEEESFGEAHDHHHDHDHDHHSVGSSGQIEDVEYDEHVWTSPVNMMSITDALCDAMCRAYPKAAEAFSRNASVYKDELVKLDSDIRTLTESVSDPVIIVADRFPLLYFCEEYGISYYAAFSGCATSTEPSSATVDFLIEKTAELSLPVVFKTDMSSGNVAEAVATASGATVRTFYSCHTVSKDDFAAGEGYISLMRRNLSSLGEAFVSGN